MKKTTEEIEKWSANMLSKADFLRYLKDAGDEELRYAADDFNTARVYILQLTREVNRLSNDLKAERKSKRVRGCCFAGVASACPRHETRK